MEYVRSEAASFVAEDIDCGGVEYSYFPAQVGTLSEGQTFSAHAVCGDKRALEAEIVKALAGMDEGQHVEVYDSDGNVHTIEAGEMTAEECQALSEFDGW